MQFYQTDTKYLKGVIGHVRCIEKYSPYELTNKKATSCNFILFDDEMLRLGRPYYQIHPQVFEDVSSTTLDLDIEQWKVPFDVFEIRMPKTEKPLIPIQPNNSIGVMSIQIFRDFHKKLFACSDEGIPFTYKYIKSTQPEMLSLFRQFSIHTAIKINFCDFSAPHDDYKKHSVLTTLSCEHGVKIREAVEQTIQRVMNKERFYSDDSTIEDMSACACNQVIKLALGVSLLATASQKIVEYDVLSKHLEAYRKMRKKGDVSGCRNIERKASKKGKYGWNIGKPTSRHLPLSDGDSYANGSSQGGHHNCSSLRCGHWHKYYIGKGRKKVDIKWLNPTVIRPDLPVRECI